MSLGLITKKQEKDSLRKRERLVGNKGKTGWEQGKDWLGTRERLVGRRERLVGNKGKTRWERLVGNLADAKQLKERLVWNNQYW